MAWPAVKQGTRHSRSVPVQADFSALETQGSRCTLADRRLSLRRTLQLFSSAQYRKSSTALCMH